MLGFAVGLSPVSGLWLSQDGLFLWTERHDQVRLLVVHLATVQAIHGALVRVQLRVAYRSDGPRRITLEILATRTAIATKLLQMQQVILSDGLHWRKYL